MTESRLLLLNNIVYRDEFTALNGNKLTIRDGISNSVQQETTATDNVAGERITYEI